jgi:hypothetical protein
LRSIRRNPLEIDDPDEILSNEFPIDDMDLTEQDDLNQKFVKSLNTVI